MSLLRRFVHVLVSAVLLFWELCETEAFVPSPSHGFAPLSSPRSRKQNSKGERQKKGGLLALGGSVTKTSVEGEKETASRNGGSSPSLTEKIFASLPENLQTGGAGGSSTYTGLKKLDDRWRSIRESSSSLPFRPDFVTVVGDIGSEREGVAQQPEFDVVICGGNLGILFALALLRRGFRVAVVEGGKLAGRPQEWNISKKEVMELTENPALLTEEEVEEIVVSNFGPMRCGFKISEEDTEGFEVEVDGILNSGVMPTKLIGKCREKFEKEGGKVFEFSPIDSIQIAPGEAVVRLKGKEGKERKSLTSRLVLDGMGFNSPIAMQMREGQRPDGVCLVVGSCARGFEESKNKKGDLIYADTPLLQRGGDASRVQYFWEAFPASSGKKDRTTYMFTYMDAASARPSLEDLFEDYWALMPKYQGVKLEDLKFLRVVFGLFLSYKNAPLKTTFDRIVPIGDASGVQSPLSFGGLAATIRHLPRLVAGLEEALEADAVGKEDLQRLSPYQPNNRVAWLFQQNMGVPIRNGKSFEAFPEEGTSRILAQNFRKLYELGDRTLRPFLLDSYQLVPLMKSLLAVGVENPGIIPNTIQLVGLDTLILWAFHLGAFAFYSLLHVAVGTPIRQSGLSSKLSPLQRYRLQRLLDEWEYGSGLDYYRH
uniref:FAD dependent oxidoreductase domain-containing protein n=1 Tax=Chromera velia CCMP2878 TaxID=1169474 RepID=A0A0G4HFT9_9ALVE|mmetsp:Transcript_49887/g.98315  ORF Transcript_49887/g.98315 Transcript_49887/m.98315 type:complete len:654 (+) Transcript_49887:256-2217(+)|eukprot:Cvel_27177.t1-p1 / transcript=Cvel_27177.t1 / gene=Cvel_27177 / organism=Chromera_velia_CCMP2878 / gene_product=hypothetical protein / transcript_product=hypothetical protein / location=Cvel_scaffold3351:1792-5032(-) / protein_length=653 / sequence_SO=supercontig / SO=protein_coding / is_pseudo=false